MRVALAAALAFGTASCSSGTPTEATSSSSAVAKAWTPRAVKGVSLRSDGVYLDNAWVAELPASDAIDKIQKLKAASRAKREKWKEEAANSNKPFPGAEQIELPDNISCRAAISVALTLMDAGFPNLSFIIGGHDKLEVPIDGSFAFDFFERPAVAPHAWFQDGGRVVVRDKPCYAAFDEVDPEAIAEALAALYPTETKYPTLVVGCDAGVPFRRVLDSYFAARTKVSKPNLQLAFGGSCVEGAERVPDQKPLAMPPKLLSAAMRGHPIKPANALGKAKVKVGKIDAPPAIATALETAIAPLNPKLAGCYAQAMEEMLGAFSGNAIIALELGKLGGVIDVRVASSDTTVDPGALSCISDQLSVVQLDPKPDKRTTVRVPLELSL